MTKATETAAGPRQLRVLAGESMVTPTTTLEFTTSDGRREILRPGRSRLAPDHPIVRLAPEKFQLCCRDDRTSAPLVFRSVLERARRELEAELGRGSYLPETNSPTGEEPWRL